MGWKAIWSAVGRQAIDFALPPRCAGCGAIVEQVDSFCTECWTQLDFLGSGGCDSCGLPLLATEAEQCAACLARPPRIERTRAAVAYGDIARSVALKLKYGRKVALARTMAKYMAPLAGTLPPDAVLVPVPLHRRRLWQRGFNQAVLVARELGGATGLPVHAQALRRTRATPPLRGFTRRQRQRAVAGAFKAHQQVDLDGRTVVLVDDVLTTGSTAEACARALKKAGAGRVELLAWARVVRPAQFAE